MKNHPFHMVTLSPWPILLSLCLMNLLMSTLIWMYLYTYIMMIFNFFTFIYCLIHWFRDVIRESTFQGCHTYMVIKFLKFSMILFIISELFFFISFFWTYFHSSIVPNIEINMMWPPKNINFFNPYDIPLLNSIILITSGITVTWNHYCMLNFKYKLFNYTLIITIMLGMYFSLIQYIEYYEASFTFNDGIYGSIFFLMTGFHGLHVIIGILMLLSCYIRFKMNQFSTIHHFNYILSLWYWHFVDVIWLFLYIFIYWWMY
uniref:Cytochrome c oxidase subunit 3 n=1 Tax=Eucera floralia TaxID=599063 RepID=A0A343DRI4_9HYME|nr:cytochrome c oxidase subunit 3 [Eucera floralia]